MNGAWVQLLAGLLGFTVGTIPFNYLGCPIFKGKPKTTYFQCISDNIKAKLSTWKGIILSIMGRIQLVKSIIHGMLVYSFHVYMWPHRILCMLDSWIKNFIWSGDIHTRKVCTVSWKVFCLLWSARGLDVKPTRLINESFMLKLAWQLTHSNSQWAELFRWRYFTNGRLTMGYIKSSVWTSLKVHVGTSISNSLWVVGTGANINLWADNWLGESLVDLFHIAPFLHDSFTATVADVIFDGDWNLPSDLLPHVNSLLDTIVLPVSPLPDSLVWMHSPDGGLTSK